MDIPVPDQKEASVVIKGGVGNKLFQIAMLLAYCKRYNYKPVIDLKYYQRAHHERTSWEYFIRNIEKVAFQFINYYNEHDQKNGAYVELPHDQYSILLEGYFQSEKYPRKFIVVE